MGWVERGGKRYLYRSVRRGGRVTSVYIGLGRLGLLLGLGAEAKRARAKAEVADRRAAAERWAAAEAPLAELERLTDLLAAAALRAAGYHRHDRGAWRRKRGTDRN